MSPSGRRDSTTASADWLLAASIALAIIVITAGVDFHMAGVSIRAHDAVRVLILVAVVLGARIWLGVHRWPAWITRMIMLTAITTSVATWFRFLLTTIGGADSYGYVSASELIRHGKLMDQAPIAEWISAANRMAIASPLGWAPSPDGSGIVPTYPLGLPMVMALFSAIGGPTAVFFVAPAAAALTLALVYGLARKWYNADTALFATAIVAWNPVFIAYAKQPMSDMLATMWIVLALLLAMRISVISGAVAGLAAGAAVITRPALLVAAATIPIFANRVDDSRKRVVAAALGLAVGIAIQMLLQSMLFGSPFSTGYGSAGNLFAWSHFFADLKIYAKYIWSAIGPVWLVGLWLGIMAAKPEPRATPSWLFGAVALPYLFYLEFDHWETLRFLLPGLVPLTILAANGLGKIARVESMSRPTPFLVTLVLAAIIIPSEMRLRNGSAWEIASIEARYPLAGEWINVNTPPNSIILANQHSGSLRWYGKRQTLRWDFIDPAQLKTTVRELQSHGATVYVALEGDEVKMFDTRFAGMIDQLQVDHVGSIRNVSFRRLLAAE